MDLGPGASGACTWGLCPKPRIERGRCVGFTARKEGTRRSSDPRGLRGQQNFVLSPTPLPPHVLPLWLPFTPCPLPRSLRTQGY